MTFFDCCPGSVSNEDGSDTGAVALRSSTRQRRDSSNKRDSNSSRRLTNESSAVAPWNSINCNTPVNPYKVLELRKDATSTEIIRSYRKLALFHHPGRKIACPLERRKRLQYFEVLAACYETLMHTEFRNRCDVLLKEIEKKRKIKTKGNASIAPDTLESRKSSHHPISSSRSLHENEIVVKGSDSMHGITSMDANSRDSNETVPRNNCSAMSSMIICASAPSTLRTTLSNNINFAISRDGPNGFRALADSSSLSQASADEDAEIHFSEATVNRLFGGPLASLHRARNFQAFSDPYVVFDKVFGNQKPLFPRITIADIDESTEEDPVREEEEDIQLNPLLLRSSPSFLAQTDKKKDPKKKRSSKENNKNAVDLTTNTEVFVSSRVVNGRKITKTETVHIDPLTGIASVNVTVDGEFLEPIVKKKKKSLPMTGGSVADWLLCFGMSRSKIAPAPTGSKISTISTSPKSSKFCQTKENICPSKDKLSSSCHDFRSIYVDILEDFYVCNNNFYEECNKYMQCGTSSEILEGDPM